MAGSRYGELVKLTAHPSRVRVLWYGTKVPQLCWTADLELDERLLARSPKARCPRCGKRVARRKAGQLREHERWRLSKTGGRYDVRMCGGSGLTVKQARPSTNRRLPARDLFFKVRRSVTPRPHTSTGTGDAG
jgi:hypothetical protein